jgi:hypothetical protein
VVVFVLLAFCPRVYFERAEPKWARTMKGRASAEQSSFARKNSYAALPKSPRSGRMIVAQRLIAGIRTPYETQSAQRTTELKQERLHLPNKIQPSAHGLSIVCDFLPAVNCWASVIRPLRGLFEHSSRMHMVETLRRAERVSSGPYLRGQLRPTACYTFRPNSDLLWLSSFVD